MLPGKLQAAIRNGVVNARTTAKQAAELLDKRYPRLAPAIKLLADLMQDYSVRDFLVDDPHGQCAEHIFHQLEPEDKNALGRIVEVADWLSKVAGPLHEKWRAECNAAVAYENDVLPQQPEPMFDDDKVVPIKKTA